MPEKDMSEGRQVKTQRRPHSVELAVAFHVGEQGDDGLLHYGERLRRKLVPRCPRVELGHAGSLPIGHIFVEAGTVLT